MYVKNALGLEIRDPSSSPNSAANTNICVSEELLITRVNCSCSQVGTLINTATKGQTWPDASNFVSFNLYKNPIGPHSSHFKNRVYREKKLLN